MSRRILRRLVLPTLAATLGAGCDPPSGARNALPSPGVPIGDVVIHPLHATYFACFEHPEGQLRARGDALGADCAVSGFRDVAGGAVLAPFRGEGRENADWYGWDAAVLAPFAGVVDSVAVNPQVNRPGVLGRPPASRVVFRRADGVRVVYAHVQGIAVRAGDTVRAGQAVARVGNNGISRAPHTHVAAWRGAEPLQIRFDLRAMGALRREPPIGTP